MTTVEVLKAARTRIERGWCKHANARDVSGALVYSDDASAVAWCVYGAVGDDDDASQVLRRVLRLDALAIWNDAPGRTREEVLEAFDKAIALAEAATSRDAAGMKP